MPSPMKCLLIASTQCKRKLCNIALVPSITTNTAMVRKNHMKKVTTSKKTPTGPVVLKPMANVMVQRTTESC